MKLLQLQQHAPYLCKPKQDQFSQEEELGTQCLPNTCGYRQLLAFRTEKESFLQEGSPDKLTTVQWKNTYQDYLGSKFALKVLKVRRHKNAWVEEGKE